MSSRSFRSLVVAGAAGLLLAVLILVPHSPLVAAAAAQASPCTSGPRTLAQPGSVLYPDQGNGGYKSVQTTLFLEYDSTVNLFLPGTHADLTIRTTQCLTDFSFDFERSNSLTATGSGPNMTIQSVTVNGLPAAFAFVQPTYPGDPAGQDDPDPLAHAASSTNPVSATNPNPPACSPQGSTAALNGSACPANKLVVTPDAPIPSGSTITVTINYTGRPGVHVDGDGSSEGWFRVNSASDSGGVVTSEPVGHAAWMPLNNHPTAAPTYDVHVTVPNGRAAVSSGVMDSVTTNAPSANFPNGSLTYHWIAASPVPSFRLALAVGNFDVSSGPTTGAILLNQYQSSAITAARKITNKALLDQQDAVLQWLSTFAGPFPFEAMGNIVSIASTAFEQASSSANVFTGSTVTLPVLNELTFEQWFGARVAESDFNLTFIHAGLGIVAQYLQTAGNAATNAGGLGTPAGDAAFDASLVSRFNTTYNTSSSTFWTVAPSNPSVRNLFSTSNSYTRPSVAFLALRQIFGASGVHPASDRWIAALRKIQSDFGGQAINKAQFENVFHQFLPNQSPACQTKLDAFFTEWLDTAYPSGGGANRPQITGPGLAGGGFYDDASPCTRADQTVPFGALSDRPVTDPDFALSAPPALSSAGLPVAFSAGGVCTIVGTVVHLTGSVGTCTITASQTGNGVYKPVNVPQSFQATGTTSADIAVVRGGFTLNPATRRYAQTVTLTNNGPTASGLVSLVLDNLRTNATLFNGTGVTVAQPPAGSPYINVTANLLAGQRATVTLQFTNPTNAPITYEPRVIVGAAGR